MPSDEESESTRHCVGAAAASSSHSKSSLGYLTRTSVVNEFLPQLQFSDSGAIMRIFQFTWQGQFALKRGPSICIQRSRIVAAIAFGTSLMFWSFSIYGGGPQAGLVVPAIGAGFLILAVWIYRSRILVSLKNGVLSVRRATLFGDKSFEDPVSSYRGVIQTTSLYRRLTLIWVHWALYPSIEDVIVQRIELIHPNRKWSVPIYQTISEHIPRDVWEGYATELGLPLLIGDGDGLVERSPEDVDKSIRELAEEGKLNVNTNLGSAPLSFKMRRLDNLIHISIRRPAVGWWWLILAFTLPVVAMSMDIKTNGLSNLSRSVPGFLFVSLPGFYLASIRNHVLIHRDRIEWLKKHPIIWSKVIDEIGLNEIEQISVSKIVGDSKSSLLISSDDHGFRIARGVKPKHLEWLRDLITSAVITA
jgi:hypothetical protein